jgi:hypothetical protein
MDIAIVSDSIAMSRHTTATPFFIDENFIGVCKRSNTTCDSTVVLYRSHSQSCPSQIVPMWLIECTRWHPQLDLSTDDNLHVLIVDNKQRTGCVSRKTVLKYGVCQHRMSNDANISFDSDWLLTLSRKTYVGTSWKNRTQHLFESFGPFFLLLCLWIVHW